MSKTHLTSITKRFTDLLKSGDEELNGYGSGLNQVPDGTYGK
jgi:hypothetical protein